MSFRIKYEIIPDYIKINTKRRSGRKINEVKFAVIHDSGNPKSTSRNNVDYFKRTANEQSVSAHIFVDNKNIIECVPALTDKPEKAWHVLYDKPKDNQLFGADANDAAIGIEYCYGNNINADEAYKKLIWVCAYCAYYFNLNVEKCFTGHFILDPGRKTDPKSGLAYSGRKYEQLLIDIKNEYYNCLNDESGDILDKFKDRADVPEWAEDGLRFLVEKGIICGTDTGYLFPNKAITKAEQATILYRVLKEFKIIE